MNFTKKDVGLGQTILALALLAAFAPAHADDADDLARLTQLTSNVSVGVSAASGNQYDRSLFGEYNGLRKNDSNLLLDFDYVKRNDRTGTWTIFRGRDLGLDTPELDFTVNRQGDWKFSGSYREIVKHDERTVNTGMLGIGSTTPTVSVLATPGSGQDVNQELKRERLGLHFGKWITPSLQFQASFKNEDKTGTVSWGRGFACGNIYGSGGSWNGTACSAAAGNQWALLWLPQPVDSRTQQVEARLNYHTDKLFVSGGYYGSFYTDNVHNLTPSVSAGPSYLYYQTTPTALDPGLAGVLSQPMALWPDNQAHQFYLDGTYAFTPTLRSTFNLSYQHATQDEAFSAMGLAGAPGGRSSLGAEVNTTRAQFGLSAHPMRKLSVVADLRYENRNDKTPVAYYNQEPSGVGTWNTWTNSPISNREINGKLEGTYRFPAHLLGTLGINYKSIRRDLPVATDELGGLTAVREKTDETTYRAELRRSFSDSFAGSVGFVHAERNGSDWYLAPTGPTVSSSTLATSSSAALPSYLLDRKRDKVRLTGEWTPSDRTSVQLVIEDGRDHYDAPTYTGMQSSDVRLYSLDASYRLSYRWKVRGYVSRTDQGMRVNQPSTGDYQMAMRDLEDAIGVTLSGKPKDWLEVGADLAYIDDTYSYDEAMGPTASSSNVTYLATTGGLPDVTFRQTRLSLYGKYTIDRKSAVRVDLIHQVDHLHEWTWGYAGVPFNYADNTSISLNPNQTVTVLMARYIYSFR